MGYWKNMQRKVVADGIGKVKVWKESLQSTLKFYII